MEIAQPALHETINTSDLRPGIYLVKVIGESGSMVHKLMVE
jgi:hypothetical protein